MHWLVTLLTLKKACRAQSVHVSQFKVFSPPKVFIYLLKRVRDKEIFDLLIHSNDQFVHHS